MVNHEITHTSGSKRHFSSPAPAAWVTASVLNKEVSAESSSEYSYPSFSTSGRNSSCWDGSSYCTVNHSEVIRTHSTENIQPLRNLGVFPENTLKTRNTVPNTGPNQILTIPTNEQKWFSKYIKASYIPSHSSTNQQASMHC